MKDRIRWGILGTGTVARKFARGLKLVPKADLWAVGSRTVARAQTFAKEFGACHFYGSYADLVADQNLDVIYVATPHNYHQEHCLLCLQANKAVLCEKPFTTNAEEANTVIQLAREKSLFCMEAMWMRFIPLMREVKRLVKEGEIGEVCILRADLGFPIAFDENSRCFNPSLAGGSLLDLGIYPISLAFYLLGSPTDVSSYTTIGRTGVDEQATIILRYPQHLAALSCSYRTKASNEAVIAGTRARIHVQRPLLNPQSMTLSQFSPQLPGTSIKANGLRAFAKSIPGVQPLYDLVKDLLGRNSQIVKIPFLGSGIHYEIEEVMRCLKDGTTESPIMPLDETLQIMKLIDKIHNQQT